MKNLLDVTANMFENTGTLETGGMHDFGIRQPRQPVLDMHSISKHSREKRLLELASSDRDYYRNEVAKTKADRDLINVSEILGFASEKYRISDRLDDYVITAMPIVPSDLPNRNLVAFPFRALTDFSTQYHTLGYKTWKGVPTFAEHDNKDYTKAKGIVLDTTMARMKNSADEVWKVMALCAYDRTKDAALANDILTGRRDAYSMGAWVTGYNCSCCGAFASSPNAPSCEHVHPKRARLNVHEVNGRATLAYWNVETFKGFEVSSVLDPAFLGAQAPVLRNTRTGRDDNKIRR